MRKTLLFLLLFGVKLTFGQFNDNFSDGDFTRKPSWNGQTAFFSINTNQQLKSAISTVSQVVTLSTSNTLALNVKWEFSVQLNFDPSTTNFTRVYLISDQVDLQGSLNGYFIQIGENGSADSYDLYKQSGNTVLKIIDGLPKNRANINFLSTKLRVTRNDLGKWEVYTSVDEGVNYNLEGSTIDKTFMNTQRFGIYCKYTATRSDGFIFDDFNVEELVADITAPSLVQLKMVDDSSLEATFSEPLALNSALSTGNYVIKEVNEMPVLVLSTSLPHVFLLKFASAFDSGRYTLAVNGIEDSKGNRTIANEASVFYVRTYYAMKGDVVINEIFADPSPSVGLPSSEFIELWNTTAHYILLKDWKYKDLTTTYTFSADTLAPNAHIVLCASADVNFFKGFGKVIGLLPWPSLNNDRDKLSLISSATVLIDEVDYGEGWYKDLVKSRGGYSLELIDPQNRCVGAQNWQASIHKDGGTPANRNSIYQQQIDLTSPKLVSANLVDDKTVEVIFNKGIDSLSGTLSANFRLNNGLGAPITAVPQSPDFNVVLLKLNTPVTKGQTYLLTVSGITDCAGNLIDQVANTATLFMAKDIHKNDILISEILVNPKTGGADYVEIYNATDHILDISTLSIATTDNSANISNVKRLSVSTTYMPSKSYWVLTNSIAKVKQQYEAKNPTHFTEITSLPPYNNEKGTIILLNAQGIIDRFDYHEHMHFPLLRIVKGVALERVSFQKPSNEMNNFKSAAQASGFATPTYKNSQEENSTVIREVWLTSKVFSPDGDGIADVLQINYQLNDDDYLANVTIYNEKGLAVKKIFKNSTLPKAGQAFWDGLTDHGNLGKVGIYILRFEVFALSGKSKHFEKAFVLARKLN